MTISLRTTIATTVALGVAGSTVTAALLGLTGNATAAPTTPARGEGTVSAQVRTAPTQVALPVQKPAAPAAAPKARPVTKAASAAKPAARTTTRTTTTRTTTTRTTTTRTTTTASKPAATSPKPAATSSPTSTSSSTPVRGDDYPFRNAAGNDLDTWGFTQRQCVSFAAHRLAQAGRALDNGSQQWGSAFNWDETARRLGRTVSSTPRVGAIAQWNVGESSKVYVDGSPRGTFTAGSYGHVGYVAKVYSDGSVLIEQYNLGGDRSYSSMRMTAPRYVYA